jgi:hypothetical protein
MKNINISKWPPEYDSVKVIILVVLLVVAGFFVYKYMQNEFGSTGRVINNRRGAPVENTQPVPSLPVLALLPATAISATSAMLNATVPTMDQYNSATLSFEYGLTTAYGKTTTPATENGKASARITGLSCGKTYHYRLIATNAVGTSGSESKTFRTLACR